VSWLRRLLGSGGPERPAGLDVDVDVVDPWLADAGDGDVFVCTTCGRSDLPETGGWDPPICQECDAAINFAAIEEVEITEGW
jgi:hypothetical protein